MGQSYRCCSPGAVVTATSKHHRSLPSSQQNTAIFEHLSFVVLFDTKTICQSWDTLLSPYVLTNTYKDSAWVRGLWFFPSGTCSHGRCPADGTQSVLGWHCFSDFLLEAKTFSISYVKTWRIKQCVWVLTDLGIPTHSQRTLPFSLDDWVVNWIVRLIVMKIVVKMMMVNMDGFSGL